jgi:hypothetical protein
VVNQHLKSMSYAKKIWLLICSLLVIIGICVGLHYFVGPEDNLTLLCRADLYTKDAERDVKVGVDIKVAGDVVTLKYRSFESGGEMSSMILSGKVDQFDLTSMTFKLKLDQGQVVSSLSKKSFSNHMKTVIDSSRLAITNGSPLSLEIHLLEIDEKQDYAIIQFSPDDGLWGCDLKVDKLAF